MTRVYRVQPVRVLGVEEALSREAVATASKLAAVVVAAAAEIG